MLGFVVRRLIGLIPVLAAVLVVTFLAIRALPGDPVMVMLSDHSSNVEMATLLGFGLFTFVNAGAALLRSFVLLSAGSAMSYGIASNVARRLFRLLISWFEKRHVGDILSRFQSVAPIQQALTQGAVAAVIGDLNRAVLHFIIWLDSVHRNQHRRFVPAHSPKTVLFGEWN